MIDQIQTDTNMPDSCIGYCCTRIENFGVTIGRSRILENVDLHMHCGELTAVIGPNGAGKSTLLKAILGEVPHSGDLKFLDEKGIRSGCPLFGYVPQHFDFDPGMPISVLDFFVAGMAKRPAFLAVPPAIREQVIEKLAVVEADHLINRRLGSLSGGELQRVLLAFALVPLPDILLLDEPSAGIDQNGLELFYRIVSDLRRNFDLSVLLVSHDLEYIARYADRAVLLNKTVVCSGAPVDVFSDSRTAGIFGRAAAIRYASVANGCLSKGERK